MSSRVRKLGMDDPLLARNGLETNRKDGDGIISDEERLIVAAAAAAT